MHFKCIYIPINDEIKTVSHLLWTHIVLYAVRCFLYALGHAMFYSVSMSLLKMFIYIQINDEKNKESNFLKTTIHRSFIKFNE